MKETRRAALELLLGEDKNQGRGVKQRLAARIGKKPAQISQWLSGYRTIEEDTAREIEKNAGKPLRWMDEDRTTDPQSPIGGRRFGGARMSGPLAQNLSQLEPIIEPNTIRWESILSAQPLPPVFKLALPDDALAPAYPAGALFIWSTSKPARTGSVVLILDSFGQPHARLHAQGRTPGQWIAQATGPGFQPFDGASVTLLAVAEEERRPMP